MSKATAIIDSNGIKIFSTNKQNIIEANDNNIIEVDSEFREVIKKGYLLNNINLSTIPTIIQDAINAAVIDAKNATLSDELIETLKQSLLNLDDGVYKKTYIDNMMTYVENLLTSKVNLETVASIADSKIALATENLAATSQIELLTSRVGNSESEITNVKNTINTKDLARATQIEELEASINDTFAGYSEAIDLVVGSDGSIKSQKIESLTTNIGLQLQEINQLIVDTDGEWKANSMKLITNPSGAITGYSFQDGSGLRSNFTINADSFKIANSTNTYIPFSIVDNNIVFNGKVSFSNTTTSSGDNLIDVLDTLQNDLTGLLNDNNTSTLLEITNLDGKIDTKEQELINSINIETQNRIDEIANLVLEDAELDGKITTAEQNRINAINAVSIAYKNYTAVVTKAMADGVLTAEEQTLIADALSAVNLAKARFQNLEDETSNLFTMVGSINTTLSSNAITMANLDGKIDTKEQELINSINIETQNRIDEIANLVLEDAELDGKITTAEQNRINAINAVSIAYKNYTAVVTKAMADGVLTAEEQTLIADALSAVNLAKARFSNIEETIIDISEKISSINTNNTLLLLEAANLDNKINKQEQDFINNLLSEEKSRISDILDRVKAEAQLDGKITTEEQNRINAINNLDTAYKNYISIVTKAMADGVLTPEEQTLIADATDAVNLAKARFLELEDMINNISKVEDIDWQSEVQAAINNNATTIDGSKIVTNEAFVNNLNALGGVIAENISASEIVGKTITGGVINGARINGAVIKASYLDLDGELEVLTNYHISVATRNSNPSLYSDAIYISADNEYRIPSWSTVRESTATVGINVGSTTYNSSIHSYAMANAGNNIKAVKINPQINVTSNVEVVNITYRTGYFDAAGNSNGPILNRNDSLVTVVRVCGVACTFTFKTGEWYDASGYSYYYNAGLTANNNGSVQINVPSSYIGGNTSINQNITINGMLFNVQIYTNMISGYFGGNDGGYSKYVISPSLKITLLAGTYNLASNWSNSYSLISVSTSGITDRGFGRVGIQSGTAYATKVIRNSSAISINNML